MDKSYILKALELMKKNEEGELNAYLVVAPSVSSQFHYAKLGQVITGCKKLGFHDVVEAALGADLVAFAESKELAEKGFLISSCCPAFVRYVKKEFPDLAGHVSHNLSPMARIAQFIKETDPKAQVVCAGPCMAKKMEQFREDSAPYIDCMITFEELQALIDAKEIDLKSLEESPLDNASYFGRIFARSGGLSEAVAEALKEQGHEDFPLNAVTCDGIEECRKALILKSKGFLKENFIEGMACQGGCIGGAGVLTHGDRNKAKVDEYGKQAFEKKILDAVAVLEI